jgi:acetyl esterase/lipase
MKREMFCIVAAAAILVSGGKARAEPETVFLWPAKVEEFKGKPTEEISPDKKGGVTRLSKILSPSITVFPAPASDKPAPAVVVCPGGGYSILAIDKEGTEIAGWLNSIGRTAFVLKYTVPGKRDEAFKDIQRAMGVIRQNAGKWNIDPEKLGVIGFSAGGNLAARLGNAYQERAYEPVDEADRQSCKPAFCMLIYPAWLDAVPVSEASPRTFIVQTKDDNFSKPTIPYAEALKGKGIACEFHLFDAGGHGYGLRPSEYPVSKWPELAEKWMAGH